MAIIPEHEQVSRGIRGPGRGKSRHFRQIRLLFRQGRFYNIPEWPEKCARKGLINDHWSLIIDLLNDRKSCMARPHASREARGLRITQLLDAAVSLWLEQPEKVPRVEEVARKAGLAKGTVYLYFRCKEDLLLAAHERHVHAFFDALIDEASSSGKMTFEEVMRLVFLHIVEVAAFLPLATLVAGLMHKGISPEASASFNDRISERLMIAGELLGRHFSLGSPEGGVRILMRSYALILGLWQLLGSGKPICTSEKVSAMMLPGYASELEAALTALWNGTMGKEIQ